MHTGDLIFTRRNRFDASGPRQRVTSIPEPFLDLFERETYAHFATLMPDGTPQVTPVWVDYDAEADRVLVNTARGRQKEQNATRNPKVGLSMSDPDVPVELRGSYLAFATEGEGRRHLRRLAPELIAGEPAVPASGCPRPRVLGDPCVISMAIFLRFVGYDPRVRGEDRDRRATPVSRPGPCLRGELRRRRQARTGWQRCRISAACPGRS